MTYMETIILHPALDIKRNIATVGFRQKTVRDRSIKEENIHFIGLGKEVRLEKSEIIELPDRQVFFEHATFIHDFFTPAHFGLLQRGDIDFYIYCTVPVFN